MPKQNGFLKVEGTMGDVSFYKKGEDFFIRSKGGVSKERILTDPAFKRTRENGTEFGTITSAGRLFRNANAILIKKAYDGTLNTRLTHLLAKVKNADLVSVRGQRNITGGLTTPEGKAFLRGFDFNSRSQLRSIFAAPYTLDIATGKLGLTDFIPAEQVDAPPHATHVGLQTAFVHVDFGTQLSEVAYSPMEILPVNMTSVNLSITPSLVPAATGTLFYVFLVEFWQEVNGVQYALNDKTVNALTVLEVV